MALSTSLSISAKTETTITVKWTANETITSVKYRYKQGSGSYGTWTTKSASAKTGSFKITGLSANTSYTIEVDLSNSSGGTVGTITAKTYKWPYATVEDFVVHDDMAIVTVYNPLQRSGTLEILAEGTVIFTETGVLEGGGYSGLDEEFLTQIPNSMTGQWSVRITYGTHVNTSATATYSAYGYKPTITSATYADANSTVQAIIQDPSKILQHVSTPRFTITGTALYGASIASAMVTILDVVTTGTATNNTAIITTPAINSATDVYAFAAITDSRGNSIMTRVTVTMVAYSLPSAIISIARRNNFYSETDITVDAEIMPFQANTATITARWKEEGASSWAGTQTLQGNVQATLTLDNTKNWTVQITVSDSFGGSTVYNYTVGVGLPILFIDRLLRSVGINGFPDASGQFVTGDIEMNLSDTQYAAIAAKIGVTI